MQQLLFLVYMNELLSIAVLAFTLSISLFGGLFVEIFCDGLTKVIGYKLQNEHFHVTMQADAGNG